MFNLFGKKPEAVEVESLEDQISSLTAQLSQLEDRKSVEEQLETLEVKVSEAEFSLSEKEDELGRIKRLAESAEKTHLDRIAELEREIDTLENEHKIADEDIKHMIKMSTDQAELKMKEFKVGQRAKTAKAIAANKDEYQDSMEKVLQKQIDEGNALVEKVLARLPDASMKIKRTD